MTDAAIRITQSIVERFTEQYLTSIGSSIEKHDERWDITVPDQAETDLPTGQFVLICESTPSDVGEDERQLHPESSFFQEILTEASESQPTGKIAIASEETQIEIPPWLQETDVDVKDATFAPYYDRSALAILYRISVETVSEYQTDLLRATVVDSRSRGRLPNLEETFLDATLPTDSLIESQSIDIEKSKVSELIAGTRETVVERVQPEVDEIHQDASRAADAEIEEYRKMQQQRIEELEERKSRISARIDDLSDSVQQSSDQENRVEALQKRKELKSEYEDIDTELEELERQRDQGYPEKQREIRERHALEVVVTPLTITQVEYERGEIELELVEGAVTHSLTLGYGHGVGVTEGLNCEFCGQTITGQNPLRTIQDGLRCSECQR